MKKLTTILTILLLILLFPLYSIFASPDDPWTNERMRTEDHPRPTNFTVTETGFIADLEDDTQIIYTWVYPELLLGEWGGARFFVCQGNFIYADELQKFSICLSNL